MTRRAQQSASDLDQVAESDGKRIAIVAPHFQEYSLRLANEIAARADTLLLINAGRLEQEFEKRVMPKASRLRIVDFSFASWLDPLRAIWILFRARPSTIHIQEPSGLLRAVICAFVVATSRWRSQIVLTVHDPLPHQGRDADVVKRISVFRDFIRRNAHVVVVHGAYCRGIYPESIRTPGQRIVTSTHGAVLSDSSPSAPDTRRKLLKVLAFGRMEAYKGLEVLCETAERAQERSAPIEIKIIGQGPKLDELEARLRAVPLVTVENAYVSAHRLIHELRETDCVVMPYVSATQSGVLAAAFANGRCVVASRVGGLPDIVIDGVNGLLIPPGDAEALVDALDRLSRDPTLRSALMRGAKETGARLLDWGRIVDDLWTNAYAAD